MRTRAGAQACSGWLDDLGVFAVAVLASLPYLARLGFYSDDWSFLAYFSGPPGFGHLTEAQIRARPGQVLYLWGLFRAFGLEPLPYHLANTLVLGVTGALCARLLRSLGAERSLAFAAAALFVVSPAYSAVRMWCAAFPVALSLLLFFASFLADLAWARRRGVLWKALALALLLASAAVYELALPMFAVAAVAAGAVAVKRAGGRFAAAWPQLLNLAALASVYAYKRAASSRADAFDSLAAQAAYVARKLVDPTYQWTTDYGLNVKAALAVHFRDGGLLLPVVAWRAWRDNLDVAASAAAVLAGSLVFWRLMAAQPPRRAPWTTGAKALLAGLAVYALGYATFLLTSQTAYSPHGIANRTAMAAALGLALFLAGVLLLAAKLGGRSAFALGVGAWTAASVLVLSGVGEHWARAFARQQAVLARVAADAGPPAPGGAVILTGVCPYDGPGIVFESSWDLADALSLAWRRPVRADVVTPRLEPTSGGLRSTDYSTPTLYPYGPGLVIYDARTRQARSLRSEDEARAYFARPGSRPACPRGFQGHGVPIWR